MATKRQILHDEKINLGRMITPCYVLNDSTRVLSGNAMQNALKLPEDSSNKSGHDWTDI